jgi:hypothetical protein
LINEKQGQGTHSTKMGADKLAENIPNAPKLICPICLTRFWISIKKASLVSVVRAHKDTHPFFYVRCSLKQTSKQKNRNIQFKTLIFQRESQTKMI